MSTTIDSLEIQIATNAGTSVSKIQELAGALGELKKGSKMDTVVKNLGNLNNALSTLNTHNFSKIASISKSLKSLSGLENIKISSTIAKQIGEIARITSSIGGDDLGKINGMAKSLSSLQSVGEVRISSTIAKQLREISNVAAQTDMGKFRQFATEIGRLAEALDPLGAKIGNIAKSFDKLPPKINKAVSAADNMTTATKKMNGELNTSGINIMSMIYNFNELYGAAQIVINAMSGVMSEAIEWDGIQYRFGRAFGEDAEEVYGYIQKINEELGINIQQFMQYSSLYGSLLSGFGLAQEKVTTISVGLTELSYDIWAAYNDRFKTLEDASEAVRSAITGEIEPIRNAGIALTEASLQEFADNYDHAAMAANDTKTALEEVFEAANTGELEPLRKMGVVLEDVESQAEEASNSIVDMVTNGVGDSALQATADMLGLGVSVEKLTEAQKSELRYATMMNAAMNQGIIGTYASEMETAEGAVRNLSQTMKTLTQAFGSLFIPILQLVVPYLSAFVELLVEAVHWVAALFGITLFEIDWGSSVGGMASGLEDAAVGAGDLESGLGGAAAAAKKLKDYTLGFDELNVISPPSESGSGGGGAGGGAGVGDSGWGDGLDLKTMWDESVFAKASQQVDELKQKIKDWFEEWKTEITIIGAALSALSIASLLGSLGKALSLGDGFLSVMGTIKKLASTAIVITLQYAIVSEFLSSYIDGEGFKNYIAALLVSAIGTGVLYSMWGPAGLVIGLAVTAAASLKAIIDNGGIDSAESATVALTGLASAAGALMIAWKKLVPAIADSKLGSVLSAAVGAMKGSSAAKSALVFMFPKTASVLAAAKTWVTATLVPAITKAITAGLTAVASALGVSTGWAVAIVAAIVAAIAAAIWAATHWDEVTKFFTETVPTWFKGVKDAVTTWWENFDIGEIIRNAMGAVEDWFAGIRDDVVEYWDGVVQSIKDIDWAGLGEETGRKVGEAFKSAKDWFAGIGEAVVEFFGKDLPAFFNEDVPAFFEETIPNAIEDIKESWNKFWKEKVPEFLEEMVNFFFVEIPEWKKRMKEIGVEIIMGVLTGIGESWTEFWKGVEEWIDGFVKGFKDALEINSPSKVFIRIGKEIIAGLLGGISEKWENLKSWYRSNVAPKFTKEYWSKTFNNIVTGLKTKLDEAWKKVKDFFDVSEWKKKVVDAIDAIKENFKIPELPKIKLEVAWSTNVGSVKKAVYEALGLDGWPSLRWSTYASGGFPSMGEMFIAREAGPEMVGTIGSRSAVVNNDQIVAAVSQGVYSAVVAAMNASTGNGGQNVNVYLDGKQIYASVKRTEAERGVSLMGNQLGYSY